MRRFQKNQRKRKWTLFLILMIALFSFTSLNILPCSGTYTGYCLENSNETIALRNDVSCCPDEGHISESPDFMQSRKNSCIPDDSIFTGVSEIAPMLGSMNFDKAPVCNSYLPSTCGSPRERMILNGGDSGIGTEVLIDSATYDASEEYNPGPNVVFINDSHGYCFFLKTNSIDGEIVYSKTIDGGISWSEPTNVDCGPPRFRFQSFSCWYDKWTPGKSGNKIHFIANSRDNDVMAYNHLDISDDSFNGSWTTIMASAGPHLAPDGGGAVTVSTAGYIFGASWMENGPQFGKYTSSWENITPTYSILNDDDDHGQLLPLSEGDILCLYEDSTANALYWFVYDEEMDTWNPSPNFLTNITSETAIGIEDANWGATLDPSTHNIYLTLNNDILSAEGDLECWVFDANSLSWTQKANIATNVGNIADEVKPIYDSLNNIIFAIYISGNDIIVKNSTNGGVSWGTAQEVTTASSSWVVIRTNLVSNEFLYAIYFSDGNTLYGNRIADITPSKLSVPLLIYRGQTHNLSETTPSVSFADSFIIRVNYTGIDGTTPIPASANPTVCLSSTLSQVFNALMTNHENGTFTITLATMENITGMHSFNITASATSCQTQDDGPRSFVIVANPTDLSACSYSNGTIVSSICYNFSQTCSFYLQWHDKNHDLLINATQVQINSIQVMQVANATIGGHTFVFLPNILGIVPQNEIQITLSRHGYVSLAYVVTFDVKARSTKFPQATTPELALPDSERANSTIKAQYQWQDNSSSPISGANVTVLWNGIIAKSASILSDSSGIYTITINTGEKPRGYYNLTVQFEKYGYLNQTVEIKGFEIEGWPVELSVLVPDTLVRGKNFILRAQLYEPPGGGLLLQDGTTGIKFQPLRFSIAIIFQNGTENTLIHVKPTDDEGWASYTLSYNDTKQIESLAGINVTYAGDGYFKGSEFIVSPDELPPVRSQITETPIAEQAIDFITENLLYIAFALICLLILSVASSYKIRASLETKKQHQVLIRSLQEIRSIRMVIIRHQDGVLLFSQDFFAAEENLDIAVAGVSAAISAFLEDIATSMLEDGTKEIAEFIRMQQRGLHILQRNGIHTAAIIISDTPVDRFTEKKLRKLQFEIEEHFAEEFKRFVINKQIPKDQVGDMVTKHLYTGLLGPIQLNETKLESQKMHLSARENHMLRELRSLKTILRDRVAFLLDSYLSHLQNRGFPLPVAAEFLLKGYSSGLFDPLSDEELAQG